MNAGFSGPCWNECDGLRLWQMDSIWSDKRIGDSYPQTRPMMCWNPCADALLADTPVHLRKVRQYMLQNVYQSDRFILHVCPGWSGMVY